MAVREHFKSDHNTAIGQEIIALKPVLALSSETIHGQPQTGLHAPNCLSE
jgi:hypothetical protein